MYERIIVPLDGSELAEQALAEAAKLAKVTGAPLFLLRVVDFTRLESYGPYGLAMEYASFEPVLEEEERVSREYLQAQAEQLAEEGLEVETGVVRGTVSRAIVGASIPGDLIVMASHGRGGVTRWLLGSVAEDVVRHSQVPVHLIRATETATPSDGDDSAE